MSQTEQRLHALLRQLDERRSWRVHELPREVTIRELRVFDARGWVEFRTWGRQNTSVSRDKPSWQTVPMSAWYSPQRQEYIGGGLDTLLGNEPEGLDCAPEVRVSAVGRAMLAELSLSSGARLSKTPHARRNRARRDTPTVKMMEAYRAHAAGATYRKIAQQLRVSHQTAWTWVRFVKQWHGDNARSVRARRLPTDRRGNPAV